MINLKHYLSICFFVFSSLIFSQEKRLLDVRSHNVDEFPTVKGELWVRNPDGIQKNKVRFSEEKSLLKVDFKNPSVPKAISSKKGVIFLVLNPGQRSSGKKELNWYKEVIRKTINKDGVINKGDKVEVLDFNSQSNGQIVYPSFKNLNFVDSKSEINKKLDNIKLRSFKYSCGKKLLLIHQAINHTLDYIEKSNTNIPFAIYVLSDDRCCTSETAGTESATEKSRRLNVPVYAVNYKSGFNSIEAVCRSSFGKYFYDSKRNSTNCANELEKYLKNFLKRHSGLIYPFSFKSNLPKDGKSYNIKIDYTESQTMFTLNTPDRPFIDVIKDNYIVVILILLFIVLSVFLIFKKIKKDKEQKIKDEREQNQRIEEIANKAQMEKEALEAQIKKTNENINAEKKERESLKAKEERLKEEKILNELNESLVQEMKQRGNLPWLDFIIEGASYKHEINQPKVIIGRDPNTADLALYSKKVSRNHAELYYLNSNYFIKDLNSSNGVFVNGKKVSEVKLNDADYIQLADVKITFHI